MGKSSPERTGDASFLQLLFKVTSNFIKIILIVLLISKLGTAVDAGLMPSGEIPQNKRENLPRVCHVLAFLGMTWCQDLFLVHLQGWKLGTR
ncbi:hypothetical protein HPG69_006500 [Diceros bicornis minor]|uniref:Uncharacterized protein n=1 Tax=Diceros bicornis minor TaxID=77932 RepID=A0A7J7F5M1_DICBM|nr:hypothetical protein HPG69_006500 [Diceros bicornis minor]